MAQPKDHIDGQTPARATRFAVIEGGRKAGRRCRLDRPEPLRMEAPELAAEMAEIFAMSLLRDHSLQTLGEPHLRVRIDRATTFTLHELLCELRNLPWCHAGPVADVAGAAASSRAGLGDAGHRRALRLNGDGQLTVGTLFRSGVALRGGSAVLSDLWRNDHAVGMPAPSETTPDAQAPMSHWVEWCARTSGAGLRLPGGSSRHGAEDDLGEMASALHRMPAARPFHNAALAALARGVPVAPGLSAQQGWGGPRLFDLMRQAETRARSMALTQAGQPDRLSRPAVTAARMSVWLAREERGSAAPSAPYREAAEILADHAPRLLDWVGRANVARRGRGGHGPNLFLPLAGAEALRDIPADCVAHLTVAGALATLLKATFDPGPASHLRMAGTARQAPELAQEADRLVANMALARVAGGGYYPAENVQDMRLGQAIAVHLLRDTLEEDNRSASIRFTDLDGRDITLTAHPRHFGRAHVALQVGGQPSPWPQESTRATAHLTRVV